MVVGWGPYVPPFYQVAILHIAISVPVPVPLANSLLTLLVCFLWRFLVVGPSSRRLSELRKIKNCAGIPLLLAMGIKDGFFPSPSCVFQLATMCLEWRRRKALGSTWVGSFELAIVIAASWSLSCAVAIPPPSCDPQCTVCLRSIAPPLAYPCAPWCRSIVPYCFALLRRHPVAVSQSNLWTPMCRMSPCGVIPCAFDIGCSPSLWRLWEPNCVHMWKNPIPVELAESSQLYNCAFGHLCCIPQGN